MTKINGPALSCAKMMEDAGGSLSGDPVLLKILNQSNLTQLKRLCEPSQVVTPGAIKESKFVQFAHEHSVDRQPGLDSLSSGKFY